MLKRTIERRATTQHRRCISRRDRIRDLDSEVAGHPVVQRIPAVRATAVIVDAVVGADDFLTAVVFLSGGAFFTVALAAETGFALRADADAVADLDVRDLGADADGCADDFVADAAGVGCWALEWY
jgi:hypothetical protein